MPTRIIVPVDRRFNTPYAPAIGINSLIGGNRLVKADSTFLRTSVRTSASNGIVGITPVPRGVVIGYVTIIVRTSNGSR